MDQSLFHDAKRLVFGRPLDTHLRLERAEVIIALNDDHLGPGPRQTLQAKAWSDRRIAAQNGKAGVSFSWRNTRPRRRA